jgi:hypothetical protein
VSLSIEVVGSCGGYGDQAEPRTSWQVAEVMILISPEVELFMQCPVLLEKMGLVKAEQ